MKIRFRLFAPFALLPLMACHSGGVDYPDLLPTQQILAEPTLPDHSGNAATTPDQETADAMARADSLRRKAESLSTPVIEPGTRARMQDAVAN
ncbi:hypothetical protein PAF17_13750 [Paracoccus sp. Z330]|uniref:DUF3035 domain-containing protein n=1 Tax=Paracoccus onchidii TaxID=3017813 RepID=A0ABT4ZIH8_9RHOB|nr:hypothetical protein [Paracoccus onchidii]MDB6178561.1 hypothetical protein [Paracoccus onchidii]